MKTIYQNIEPKNQKNKYHGYHQWGYTDGGLIFRTTYKNGENISYSEWHGMKETIFFII
jgi:hypothetical protein